MKNGADIKFDIIDQQSYETGYTAGFIDGTDSAYELGYRKCANDIRKIHNQRKKDIKKSVEKLCCILQKLLGFLMLLILVAVVWASDGDATISILILPLIFVMIFSSKPILAVFRFYLERG